MQEKLIIYLHADDLTRPSWAVVDADNTIRQSAYRDSSEGLAQIAEEKDILVIVPASDVTLLTAKLPKMNRSRLAQALPFALEEQLVSEIEDLHFASGLHKEDGELPVAIVAHEKMQQWLAQLNVMQVKPNSMVPAMLALPFDEHVWHAFIQDMAIVRTGEYHGFVSDITNVVEFVDMAFETANMIPQCIHIHNYTQQSYVNSITVPVKVKEDLLLPDKFMIDLARSVVRVPYIDLLQGSYAVKKSKLPQLNKMLKMTTYLALSWVALLFLYPIVSYFILAGRVHNIDAQIAQIYKRNFPQSSSIVAPKLRMQEKLQKLDAEIGQNRLLLLLGYVGQGMQTTSSIKLKRLDFQNNQLTLDLLAGNSDDFSAFTNYLTQQGLNVKQENANLVGSRVNATIAID